MKLHQRLDRIRALELRPPLKAVLLALAIYSNSREQCWPSTQSLAECTGFTERHIRRLLRKLEDLRIIATAHRKGTSSLYTLTLPRTSSVRPPRTSDVPRTPLNTKPKPDIFCKVCQLPHQPDIPRMHVHCLKCHQKRPKDLVNGVCVDCIGKYRYDTLAVR